MKSISTSSAADILHGVSVPDPYRDLEAPTSSASVQWHGIQQSIMGQYVSGLGDYEKIVQRVERDLSPETIEQVTRVNNIYFYKRRAKGDDQGGIYARRPDGHEFPLVKPSQGEIYSSLRIYRISNDATILAYSLRNGGTDHSEVYFVNTMNGIRVDEHLPSGFASGLVFSSGCTGYFYCHNDFEFSNTLEVRFHRFGCNVNSDEIVFQTQKCGVNNVCRLIGDENTIGVVVRREEGENYVYDFYARAGNKHEEWRAIFRDKVGVFEPLLADGRIYALDARKADNSQILELYPCGEQKRVIVPPCGLPIRGIIFAKGIFCVQYLRHRTSLVRAWSLDGTSLGDIVKRKDVTITLFPPHAANTSSIFYALESFLEPPRIYEYGVKRRGPSNVIWHKSVRSDNKVSAHVVHETCTARDGTPLPIYLVVPSKASRKSRNRVLLSAYGGFGLSMTPRFGVLPSVMLEQGVTLVLACIRGGGEYGEAWHKSAIRTRRQIAINDFIDVTEYLISSQAAAPDGISTIGGSNAGLLVAAAMVQRPELFRAVICLAPLLDMVRYEQFERASRWQMEFGSVRNSEEFHALHAYSPYHGVRQDTNYPSTLFVSGDSDNKSDPAHVRKMSARLQANAAQANPILVDYHVRRGHAPALPLSLRVSSLGLRIAFLCHELGITFSTGSEPEI